MSINFLIILHSCLELRLFLYLSYLSLSYSFFSFSILSSLVYSLVDDLAVVEAGTFVCALHFFLGLLVLPQLKSVPSSHQGEQLREHDGISRSPLLTCSKISPRSLTKSQTEKGTETVTRNSTPISEFISSVLHLDSDPDPNPESDLEEDLEPSVESKGLSVSNSGSRSVLTALNKLISKVKRVQYNDEILKKRGTNRIFLAPQKYDDYRLNSLPLSVISDCLLGDSITRLEALKLLLNLLTLHPLHATQIGENKNIMKFLISSAVGRLMPPSSINKKIIGTEDIADINSNMKFKNNVLETNLIPDQTLHFSF